MLHLMHNIWHQVTSSHDDFWSTQTDSSDHDALESTMGKVEEWHQGIRSLGDFWSTYNDSGD